MPRRRLAWVVCSIALLAATLAAVSPAAGQAAPKTLKVAIKGNENNITPFTCLLYTSPSPRDS